MVAAGRASSSLLLAVEHDDVRLAGGGGHDQVLELSVLAAGLDGGVACRVSIIPQLRVEPQVPIERVEVQVT